MKAALLELLGKGLPLPGVVAWATRLPDMTLAHHAYNDWFNGQQLEQMVGRLALAAEGLSAHGIQPVRLAWIFEHARIHLALRRDGGCLALFLENRSGFPSAKIESLFEEFASLPMSATPAA